MVTKLFITFSWTARFHSLTGILNKHNHYTMAEKKNDARGVGTWLGGEKHSLTFWAFLSKFLKKREKLSSGESKVISWYTPQIFKLIISIDLKPNLLKVIFFRICWLSQNCTWVNSTLVFFFFCIFLQCFCFNWVTRVR